MTGGADPGHVHLRGELRPFDHGQQGGPPPGQERHLQVHTDVSVCLHRHVFARVYLVLCVSQRVFIDYVSYIYVCVCVCVMPG